MEKKLFLFLFFFSVGGLSTHYFDTGYHFGENSHIYGKEEKLKNIDGEP